MPATPNELSNLNWNQGMLANGLDRPDRMKIVYDLSNNYNTLTFLTDRLNGGKSKQVTGLDGKLQKPLMGSIDVITVIGSVAASGARNLRVTFTDPTYSLFRENMIVLDTNRNQGRVVTSGAGFVIISPTPGSPVLSASTMFTANMYIKEGWNTSINRGSVNPAPLNAVPYYDYNWTQTTRAASQYFRNDTYSTWVEYNGKYWYTSVDAVMMLDLAKQLERRAWFGVRGQGTDDSGRPYNENGGLIWAIKDPIRGGVIQPMASNPVKADYERFMGLIAKRQAGPTMTQTWLCGRDALTNIQTTYTQNFIQYSGQYNTFGGSEVQGLDVQMLQLAGTKVKLINCKFFDDPTYFPELSTIANGTKMGNTIIALDEGMYNGFGGGMQPAIENIYFGNKEFEYGVLNGMGMGDAFTPGNLKQGGNPYQFNQTDVDSVTFGVLNNGGIDAIATRMGIMELVS